MGGNYFWLLVANSNNKSKNASGFNSKEETMRKITKVLILAAAVSSMVAVTAVANTTSWSATAKTSGYTTGANNCWKGNSNSYATVTCGQIYDNSIVLNLISSNSNYSKSVGTVQYPSKSGTAGYSSYSSSAYYNLIVKLGPTSRYTSAGLNGNYTP